jgi:hypothetical protein
MTPEKTWYPKKKGVPCHQSDTIKKGGTQPRGTAQKWNGGRLWGNGEQLKNERKMDANAGTSMGTRSILFSIGNYIGGGRFFCWGRCGNLSQGTSLPHRPCDM